MLKNIKDKSYWGEDVKGVIYRFETTGMQVALTLDACGSEGDGYDKRIIDFVVENNIPAMIFVTPKWIKKNGDRFKFLKNNDLFSIQNHGWRHVPASVNAKKVYGMHGTFGVWDLKREIKRAESYISKRTHQKPRFYRSGAAYYDESSIKFIKSLDYQIMGFDVLGDAGTTYTAKQAESSIIKRTHSGSIIIAHMNHPERESGEGIVVGLSRLLKKGYEFIRLDGSNVRFINHS